MNTHPAPYIPISDAMGRHEYGVSKQKKTISTGGGRAWSEDEELYLLQTRLQKMPYKHIAAHLKKTELACRLHYHQLSHGTNRRKRTTSMSSGSSASGHSPILQASVPSPIHELRDAPSRSVSPPGSSGSYSSATPGGIQLPGIMPTAASTSASPHLPAILPKPTSTAFALASANAPGSTGTASRAAPRGYPTPLHEAHSSHVPPAPSTGFRNSTTHPSTAPPHATRASNGPGPLLRLDCCSGGVPAPASPASHPVDMARLTAAYNAHRTAFWAAVASDYGPGANPAVLERAWRGTTTTTTATSSLSSTAGPSPGDAGAKNLGIAAQTPITPVASPDEQLYGGGGGAGQGRPDKTRISAILGIDANPRSPQEREMVRRMEEERCSVGVVGA
ncbi:hypothetical protein VTK56DRAFT_2372 [Thermocarpiscus australiensis]